MRTTALRSMIIMALCPLLLAPRCGDKSTDTGSTEPEEDTAVGSDPHTGSSDSDGDGWPAPEDCDDDDPAAHPYASEICDGVDNDCDGEVDEDDAVDAPTWFADADGDGFGDADSFRTACTQPTGCTADDSDCDDGDSAVFPGAQEVCNQLDDDCDGESDESDAADAPTWYLDSDGDGFGDPAYSLEQCEQPSGWVLDDADCDDFDASVHPGADEICDEADNDCDDIVDGEQAVDASAWYADADQDGFGDAGSATTACTQPEGHVADAADCDDGDGTIHPAASEVCDGLDNDCDGTSDVDASDAATWLLDADGDGFGDEDSPLSSCSQPSGYVAEGGDSDCDDGDASVYPGAAELCDGQDGDCDGTVDEDDALDAGTWNIDYDGDGFGSSSYSLVQCDQPTGYVAAAEGSEDCDDGDASIYPGAAEYCGSVDHDCDGEVNDEDSLDALTRYTDLDGDGYGDGSASSVACEAASGLVADGSDCDDGDVAVNPSATESCNGIDDDCDGALEPDDDGDGWDLCDDCDDADSAVNPDAVETCDGIDNDCSGVADDDSDGDGDGWYACDDCDDGDAAVYPGASEHCDGQDEDCDGTVDEDDALDAGTWTIDYDGDGFGSSSYSLVQCDQPSGYVAAAEGAEDCDDGDASIYPGAPESCGSVDHDCDGEVNDDDSLDVLTWYADLDGDGYGDGSASSYACEAASGLVADGSDCDDGDAAVNPSATESCNGIDDDCDGALEPDDDGDGWDLCDDCDDADNAVNPDATETCDGIDNDCSGVADDDGDGDGDGWYACDDCDDGDASVHPDAEEICGNGVDDDCDGSAAGCGFDGEVTEDDEFLAIVWGETAYDLAGVSVRGAGDVDGDGFEDILVGAEQHEVPGRYAGAAYLLHGPLSGVVDLSASQAKWMGVAAYDYAGSEVDGGSDIDGDGNADFLIGAGSESTVDTSSGAVYLIYGPASGDASLADADVVIYGERYYDQLGKANAMVGDTDGDGYDDLLLGSKGAGCDCDAGTGAAYLFLGPLSGSYSAVEADALLEDSSGNETGRPNTALGDVDGDGLADILIGANASQLAMLLLGPVSATSAVHTDNDAAISGPGSVTGPGDVDGDGLDDILLGTGTGCTAYLLSGTIRGSVTASTSYLAAVTSLTSSTCYDFLGRSVGRAGDVDADGYADILLDQDSYGNALLFYGPLSGTYAPEDADSDIDPAYDIGDAMDHADVDGDGYSDLLLGASGADLDGTNSGGVYILQGGLGP